MSKVCFVTVFELAVFLRESGLFYWFREKQGMTRSQFAALTRFGDASLGRWERGALVQNGANDQLIYLLGFADNVERLRARTQGKRAVAAETEAPTASTIVGSELSAHVLD